MNNEHSLTRGKPAIMLTGMMIGLPLNSGMEFMPGRDYVACAICGDVYQHAFSRLNPSEITGASQEIALNCRKEWSYSHARSHSSTEHRQLWLSGRKVTPEALHKLVTLGCIPVSDLALDEESAAAGLEAARMPTNDVEGVRY